ncbi:radical SAM protein [Thermosulfurimonas marina]|uniref:7-carboxy-7-deazaguanine synthase n=1 Tax=Thermosulfurimonas marina TaxID=2047767 RepID=A0A6H1WUT8_9BACT|nr:radical SAM protein [Thermosulfurimonas marina]
MFPTEPVLRVFETFVSLQGEGPACGRPAFFVRLAGCNLACRWCDTSPARSPEAGRPLTLSAILKEFEATGLKEVLLTGGEPLLQEASLELMRALLRRGARIYLETNGSLSLRSVPREVVKIMDFKTPSSGMNACMLYENLRYLTPRDAVKFVIADEEDYRFAREKTLELGLFFFTEVYFSPVWGEMSPERLARLILEDRLPVRLQVQLHKFLGLP